MERNVRRALVGAVAVVTIAAGAGMAAASPVPAPVFSKAQVATTGGDVLSGVACVSPTSCFAVGASDQQPQSHGAAPIVAEWNGKTWSVGQGVQRDQHTYFDDIACPTASTCFAVGA